MEKKKKSAKSASNKSVIKPLVNSKRLKKNYYFYLNNNPLNLPLLIKSNQIDQSKYNIFTFLPKALLFQFYRLANIYFLVIAILQCIPQISPLTPSTAVIPIIFVISVSMIREGIEDLRRHEYDNLLNNEPVTVFRMEKWIEATSGSLLVGELVMVKKNDPFPADLILLDSNLKEGICFIETGTLDGEKTLKNKIANKVTTGIMKIKKGDMFTAVCPKIEGKCICDSASSDLYNFDGTLEIKIHTKKVVEEKISIESKQMLLKGI